MALAQELDPVSAPIFANEIQSYRTVSAINGLDETGLRQELARASSGKLSGFKADLDQIQQLLDDGQVKKAGMRLKKTRNELQSWIDESGRERSRSPG